MAYVMTGAYRHGKHGHRGYIDSAGWVKVSDSAWLFYVESEWILRAAEHSARSRKPRFEVSGGYIRCIQGHSAGAWGSNEIDLDRLYGRAELDGEVELLHGTDVANVEGIVRFGLLPGGGSVTNRVAVHWIEHAQGGAQPGLRSGSTALVTTKVKYLREAGITLYRGSENVILTTAVPSEHLREVFAWNYEEAERGDDLALHDGRALKLIEVEAEKSTRPEMRTSKKVPCPRGTQTMRMTAWTKLSAQRSLVTRRQLQDLVHPQRHRLRVRRRWQELLE